MKPEDSWRAKPAVPRSPEPETRALDAAEIARLVAQVRVRSVPLPQRGHPASATARPAEWHPSNTFTASASAQVLAHPAAVRPRGMPPPPGSGTAPRRGSPPGRSPADEHGAKPRELELSDLHARPPKPWSDHVPPRRSPADKPATQPLAERRLTTGSKRWRTPVDPPARDLTLRLSPDAIRAAYLYRDRDPDSRHVSPSSPDSGRAELGRRIAIALLAVIALSILWLGPRGSTTHAADRVGGARPQDVVPTAAAQVRMNPSGRVGVTDIEPRPAVVLSAVAPPSIPTAVPAGSAPARARELAAATPAPRAAEAGKPGRREPAPRPPATAAAIEQLALGHQREALAAYLQLAAVQPERPAYPAIARILQHKLTTRCTARSDAVSTACQEASP
jgi:hypothetical protein